MKQVQAQVLDFDYLEFPVIDPLSFRACFDAYSAGVLVGDQYHHFSALTLDHDSTVYSSQLDLQEFHQLADVGNLDHAISMCLGAAYRNGCSEKPVATGFFCDYQSDSLVKLAMLFGSDKFYVGVRQPWSWSWTWREPTEQREEVMRIQQRFSK